MKVPREFPLILLAQRGRKEQGEALGSKEGSGSSGGVALHNVNFVTSDLSPKCSPLNAIGFKDFEQRAIYSSYRAHSVVQGNIRCAGRE
jgi:hypothetical protein